MLRSTITEELPQPANAFEADLAGTSDRSLSEQAIDRLRRQGGVFVEAVRVTRMPMVVTDPTLPGNPIVFANASFLKLSGYRMDEVLGQDPFFMNGADTDPEDAARFRTAIHEDRDEVIETVQYRKDGSRLVTAILLSAFKKEDGSTANQFLSYLDITRRTAAEDELVLRRRVEERLRQSEERLALVVGKVPVGIALFDVHGKVRLRNPHLADLIGDLIPSQDSRAAQEWVGFDMAGRPLPPAEFPGARVLRGEDASVPTDFRRVHAGEERWLRVTAVPLRDGNGVVSGGITALQDITRERKMQSEMQALAERNAEILESISDAFYAVDHQWRFTYVNQQAERWWGRHRRDLIGRVFWEEFPSTLESSAGEAHRVAAAQRRVVRLETLSPVLGHWVDIAIYPTADGGLSVYFRDISEKKHAENVLRESETRLSAIVANAKVGISELSVDGRFIEANGELCQILGRKRDEILQLSLTDVTHPEDVPSSRAAVEKILGGQESVEVDKRYVRPDGSVVWASSRLARLQHGEDRPDTLLVVTIDLTARREAERALRQSEERHRMILETARDYAIFTTDAEGRIDTWPPGARTVFGWSADEIIGRHIATTFVPEDRDAGVPQRELTEAASKGVAPDIRWHQRKDGKRVFIEGWTRPLLDDQTTPHGFLKVGQDVTQRHEWEEAQKVLVAELQHRTRNLIAVVRSIANQTMAQTGPTEAFRAEFNDRLAALSRVQGLLSRVGEERVAISDLVRMELDALGAAAAGDRVTISGPAVPLRTSVVQTLSLALHELATNARKYGAFAHQHGRIRISWTIREPEGESRRLLLEWREDGLELPPPAIGQVRHGYGRELIEQALPYSLGAKTTFDLTRSGLLCTIDLPLVRRV